MDDDAVPEMYDHFAVVKHWNGHQLGSREKKCPLDVP